MFVCFPCFYGDYTSNFNDKTEIYHVNINIISYAIKNTHIKQNSRKPGKVDFAPNMKTTISNSPSRINVGAIISTD